MKLLVYKFYCLLFIWGISDRLFSIYLDGFFTYKNIDTILFVGILFFMFTILCPDET